MIINGLRGLSKTILDHSRHQLGQTDLMQSKIACHLYTREKTVTDLKMSSKEHFALQYLHSPMMRATYDIS